MTEKRFPKKEFIILSVGEALCVLVTVLGFLGVSVSGIIEFEFSYKVITGALFGAVVTLLNFIFLSVSVNKAVDEYMALRGDKEMTDEEAEEFAKKNSGIAQKAVKKSFIVRMISIAAALVVSIRLGWFNPLATIVPIIAYQPILTWGIYVYDAAQRVIARFKSKDAMEDSANEDSTSAEPAIEASDLDESESLAVEASADKECEEENRAEEEKNEVSDTSDTTVEEDLTESLTEDVMPDDSEEVGEATEEEDEKIEDENLVLDENKENTEGSDVDGI